MPKLKPESLLVAEGRPLGDDAPLNTPLVPASNFTLGGAAVYAREDGTDTWRSLESTVGALEGGEAVAFASGMAAAAAVFAQVPPGGEIVMPDDAYQGVAALAREGADQGRWRLRRLPTDDTPAWLQAGERADLLWLETPSNPMLVLADLEAIGAAPRRRDSLLVVDNTFATPLNQQPLRHGADLSLHSATKFIGGHSDLLAGIVAARSPARVEALRHARTVYGGVPGTLEAFLATRGLRTLAVRLRRAEENALQLARFLEVHSGVTRVRYPGLESHPQHELARRQLGGFGAILTFEVDGDAALADALCRATRLVRHATSLGAVETTMERRAVHAGQEHVPPNLLRLSVGIEDADDLASDLDQALRAVQGVRV
jgi:cystathionine gamma-synthase